jgi:uncharacterized protein with PQ loop repeat
MDIPILAGTISTVVFAVSNLPMLRKALHTRDVSSYSLSSLVMINAANLVYSLYVFTLPIGPIWGLHAFYAVSCAVMLVLCLRQRRPETPAGERRTGTVPALRAGVDRKASGYRGAMRGLHGPQSRCGRPGDPPSSQRGGPHHRSGGECGHRRVDCAPVCVRPGHPADRWHGAPGEQGAVQVTRSPPRPPFKASGLLVSEQESLTLIVLVL